MPQLVGDASQQNIPEQVRASRCSDITEIFIETSYSLRHENAVNNEPASVIDNKLEIPHNGCNNACVKNEVFTLNPELSRGKCLSFSLAFC